MAKASSEAVHRKKAVTVKHNPFVAVTPSKVNRFEMHVNREKFRIIGRTCKHDKGLPGISRLKAIRKRAETLGQEFHQNHKSNQFRDRRIGRAMLQSDETIMSARFVAAKLSQLKQHNKASKFNLNDDVVLTHREQTLEEIEQFRDERSDEENMDEALDADFTEVAHFGGDDASAKDRTIAIEDMIIEQKRRKVETAKEKDEVHNLTVKLDSNYKELVGLVGKMSKNELKEKLAPDDYDKMMREMVFEARGVVTDKLLSEDLQAKIEKERLERREQERLKRMNASGEEDSGKNYQSTHRSADDLDDGYYAYESEQEEYTLAYNSDGELDGSIIESDARRVCEHEKTDEEDNESENEIDNLIDLKTSYSDTEDFRERRIVETITKQNIDQKVSADIDLPFTIEMPDTYTQFKKLLITQQPETQSIVVERLIKCNHPSFGANRESAGKLFAFLVEYINEIFADASQEDITTSFKILDGLNQHLYDLMHLNPEKITNTLVSVIIEKYAHYRKNVKIFPSLETVIFFKLVGNLFTTSDFRHPLVSPCYVFMQHVLSKARIRTRQDIAMGLFVVTVVLEYTQLSKRFLPAVFNFLLGIVFLSIPKRPVEILKIVPPFECQGPMSKLLTMSDKAVLLDSTADQMLSEDLVLTTVTTAFKVRALNSTLRLIKDVVDMISDNVGANYFAEPMLDMLKRLPIDLYPKSVRVNYATTEAVLKTVGAKSLVKVMPPEKKPRALRLMEPRIELVYDDKRRPKVSKAKEEKLKLLHKLKRETKGAVREIRKDTEFLQSMRIKQQIKSDMERKEKVKRIYAEAALQQGELNEFARAKKKKKF